MTKKCPHVHFFDAYFLVEWHYIQWRLIQKQSMEWLGSFVNLNRAFDDSNREFVNSNQVFDDSNASHFMDFKIKTPHTLYHKHFTVCHSLWKWVSSHQIKCFCENVYFSMSKLKGYHFWKLLFILALELFLLPYNVECSFVFVPLTSTIHFFSVYDLV